MPRIGRKLPLASAGGRPQVSITAPGWRKIEKAYREELSFEVRNSIVQATQYFCDWEVFVRTAAPLSYATDQLALIQNTAEGLRQVILGQIPSTPTSIYVKHLIKKHFSNHNLPKGDYSRQIYSILSSLVYACEQGVKDTQGVELGGFQQGNAWDQWIRDLTLIVKKNGLKWRVRNDSDKQPGGDASSPFVNLIRELQLHLPKDCKRRAYADTALPKAITRARKPKRDN